MDDGGGSLGKLKSLAWIEVHAAQHVAAWRGREPSVTWRKPSFSVGRRAFNGLVAML
jgi:hypothetical protein